MADATPEKLAEIADTLLIGKYRRHVLLCVGDACSGHTQQQAAWDALKDELKRTGLSLADGPTACFRTKVGCLRVCAGGPIAVVYPDGHWYHAMTADKIPRLVQQHLVEGKPIDEWVFARNALPHPAGDAPSA
jgi:(2Fe-2S) ferredoxin